MPTPTPEPGPAIGANVRLNGPVPYLKTADPMPMLRPPDLVDPQEIGVVVELRLRDQLAVRFRRGTFLLSGSQVQPVLSGQEPGPQEANGPARPSGQLEGLRPDPPS